MVGANVDLHFETVEAQDRYVNERLPEDFARFEAASYWDRGWFWPYGLVAEYDEVDLGGGKLTLVFEGDPEALCDAQADRWEAFDGLTSWEHRRWQSDDLDVDDNGSEVSLREQQIETQGVDGGEWIERSKVLTARWALEYQQAFEEPLPAAPEGTEANPTGIGFWSLLHALFVQCGYDWYDETDACLRAMQNRVKSIAMYRGAEAAREEYERLATAWAEYEEELETFLDERDPGTATP